ncbi:HAD family hydrolase [Halogranum amylolyticum]|uniref:HAD family hydrolase n=1 Tax=Halogranum amylolyticum TaxID=660520 RepID=UPI001FCE0C94|nr:HAD hydrolase-like protein [Halogranum amylolyticum]
MTLNAPDLPDLTDLAEFDAVVYDLDGTLVRLAVNWDAVAADVVDVFADAGVDATDYDLWGMLDLADEHGLRPAVETAIADHETEGARRSERLPLADGVADHGVPVGVCSLNCEAACRVALDVHELAPHVGSVVGRDSVATRKPDPEPLLATLRALGVDASKAVFVGDSRRDEVTAERAGSAFRYVDGR